jgi:4-amino-4-deoxy-L-arabinose transferase
VFYSLGSFLFNSKPKYWLLFAFISSILIKLSYAYALPYLGLWDEQYHAVVAKNMMEDPFNPRLFLESPVFTNPDNWTYYTTWIHKQPFFLWCISLSYKFFGVNVIALRVPSILISSSLVYPLYMISIKSLNKLCGLITVTLYVFNPYFNNMHNGSTPTDHNDIFFVSLICWSVYLGYLYIKTKQVKYLFLTSLICGLAVLTKWLVGLLPLSFVWIYILSNIEITPVKKFMLILTSITFTGLVFIPWQIHCYNKYNDLFITIMQHNASHISEVVEGHEGDFLHHLRMVELFIGYNWVFLIVLIITGLYLYKDHILKLNLTLIIMVVHLFFGFVKTKMDNFTLILLPFYLTTIGYLCSLIIKKIEKRLAINGLITFTTSLLLIIISFNPSKIEKLLAIPSEKYSLEAEKNFNYHKQIALGIDCAKKNIVLNCKPYSHPVILLYSNACAYNFVPDSLTLNKLKTEGYHLIYSNFNNE